MTLYHRRPDHTCPTPPIGTYSGADPDDIWRCDCGRYWLARHIPGSHHRITHWKQLTRIRGWALTRNRTPTQAAP